MSRYILQRSIKSEVGKLAWFDAETFTDPLLAARTLERETQSAAFRAREWSQPQQRIRLLQEVDQ